MKKVLGVILTGVVVVVLGILGLLLFRVAQMDGSVRMSRSFSFKEWKAILSGDSSIEEAALSDLRPEAKLAVNAAWEKQHGHKLYKNLGGQKEFDQLIFGNEVSTKLTRVDGPLKRETLSAKIKEHEDELHDCLRHIKTVGPRTMGVQFRIARKSGKTQAGMVRKSSIEEKGAQSCVLKEIQTWQFKGNQKKDSSLRLTIQLMPKE